MKTFTCYGVRYVNRTYMITNSSKVHRFLSTKLLSSTSHRLKSTDPNLANSGNATTSITPTGLFTYAELSNKSYIKIRGPDAPKFLNGTITSKLLPHFIKKNLTTIETKTDDGNDSNIPKEIPEFDMTQGNWGLYQDSGFNGPYVTRFGQYTGLLNGKGKLITDLIVYPTPLLSQDATLMKYPTYLLELNNSIITRIVSTLETHKLTSKIKIEKLDPKEFKTWDVSIKFENIPHDVENPWIDNILNPIQLMKTPEDAFAFTESVISTLFAGHEDDILAMYVERRTDPIVQLDGAAPQLFRIVTKNKVEDISKLFNQQAFPFEFSFGKVQPSTFRKFRFHYGFVDGYEDIKPESNLPLELNFDYLPNTVSDNKGCYVGQELTARTFSTGILRKRLIPVKLTNWEKLDNLIKNQVVNPDNETNCLLEVQMKSTGKEQNIVDKTMAPNPFTTKSPFGTSNAHIAKKLRKKRPVGSLIAHEGENGIVMMRTEHFPSAFKPDGKDHGQFYISLKENENENDIENGKDIVGVVPKRPYWFHDWQRSN
ncbi:Iba57p NDAI_0D00250 [Naumovozyma dairenensis CBS 421]|uniref:Uncharacterized protein n=1 Tax=Naumovozyma dairenensis (strain ATCC 10597 / BCRC 20456 / CBS 421 / NBRC 0211 / NRRL Y-12639) TaxID=1071378 RepID=G0W978_NAUDC|nr:hypothetical protein NDAI_0D00250 [Naumovozyma dairenensis CBS 421]CCD24339.1 hypothetical protein NDAI_0D00250 [Naumovozyma dairenensis CBS 421]